MSAAIVEFDRQRLVVFGDGPYLIEHVGGKKRVVHRTQ